MTRRQLALRIAQLLITLAAFAWLSSRISLQELLDALGGLSVGTLVTATAWWIGSFAVAVLRWRGLLRAYGATGEMPVGWITRVYWIGLFYNTWAPGGVGGDLVRGVAARKAFEGSSLGAATAGLAVTGVDRVCGLIGLMLLVGIGITLWPVQGIEELRPLAAGVALVGLVCVGVLAAARRVGDALPEPFGSRLRSLPPLERPSYLIAAIGASVLTHFLTALAGYAIVRGLVPDALLTDALVFVPLSMATIYLPISVGGAGVREAAFAGFYATVGVPEQVAVAAGLSMFAMQLAVASVGGVISLIAPVE